MTDPITPPPADDIKKQMELLQTQLASLQSDKVKLEATVEQLKKKPPVVVPPTPPPAPVPAKSQQQQLEQYANDKAREAERLRLCMELGLKEEDLQGDYGTPMEMRNAAMVKAMEKKVDDTNKTVATIAESLKSLAEGLKPAEVEQPKPDTGGPSGKKKLAAAQLYEEGKRLGRSERGRWLTLAAIHRDPSKIVKITKEEPEE